MHTSAELTTLHMLLAMTLESLLFSPMLVLQRLLTATLAESRPLSSVLHVPCFGCLYSLIAHCWWMCYTAGRARTVTATYNRRLPLEPHASELAVSHCAFATQEREGKLRVARTAC